MGMFTVQTQFSKAKTNSYGDCFESRKYNKINSSPLRLQSSKMERELIFNIWIEIMMGLRGSLSVATPLFWR